MRGVEPAERAADERNLASRMALDPVDDTATDGRWCSAGTCSRGGLGKPSTNSRNRVALMLAGELRNPWR
jgi:hypothetical protein